MSAIRVLLADDHGVVRKGLRFLLSQDPEIEIAGEAEDGREAVRLTAETNPAVVIMDVAMPQLNGLDAAAQIVERSRAGLIEAAMRLFSKPRLSNDQIALERGRTDVGQVVTQHFHAGRLRHRAFCRDVDAVVHSRQSA